MYVKNYHLQTVPHTTLQDETEEAELKAQQEAQAKAKSPFKSSKTQTAAQTRQASIQEEENTRRLERWKYVHPFYGYIHSGVSYALNVLKCMKTAVMKLKFNDLGECVHRIGIVDRQFGRFMRRDWTHKVGYLKDMYTRFVGNYTSQFGGLHDELRTYLEVSVFV